MGFNAEFVYDSREKKWLAIIRDGSSKYGRIGEKEIIKELQKRMERGNIY